MSDEFRIETLNGSFDAFGMLLDFLSSAPPFSEYRLSQISRVVRQQLAGGYNVAALTPANELIGYSGWIFTLAASAELWVEDRGPLKIMRKGEHDALAVTVVVSRTQKATMAMMRRAREMNPGIQAYFKRSYDSGFRPARKQAVRNVL